VYVGIHTHTHTRTRTRTRWAILIDPLKYLCR